ncbi:Sec-independent protein translocase subunit TatA [Gephyromycinifex aptenodytis]|uniref:Sec-independent protein translocase subunit TatA n=1 Tax=Gephyromycinifex aptenodytis TaxID=2716227 RepID=UPI0014458019|nr:Sec-independent protein translocase subunit TatA [Gephyromycinifex aptenodytis]
MPAWLGGPEVVVLVLVIVIVFGWKRLPDAARSLGRSMRIFKAEVEEMKEKPSAASRDTVRGEAREGYREDGYREETYRAAEQDAVHREEPRPATGDSTQTPPPVH